jgi:hypothetical protein
MTTGTKRRAAKGGEFGANGEWYEGGKFINTVPENQKKHGSHKGSGIRKVEIAPYEWVMSDGKKSIYQNLAGIHGKVIDGRMVIRTSEQTLNYFGQTIQEVQTLADRWNAGERWM